MNHGCLSTPSTQNNGYLANRQILYQVPQWCLEHYQHLNQCIEPQTSFDFIIHNCLDVGQGLARSSQATVGSAKYPNTSAVHQHLDYALKFVQAGYGLFRLAPKSKVPMYGSKGVNDATTDLGEILRWRWADEHGNFYNIGLSCRGLLVIDVDGGEDNPWYWALSSEVKQKLHDHALAVHKTPRGGFHFIFRRPENVCWKNANDVFPGVDVKTGTGQNDNGYIVLPFGYVSDLEKSINGDYGVVKPFTVGSGVGWLENVPEIYEQLKHYYTKHEGKTQCFPASQSNANLPTNGQPTKLDTILQKLQELGCEPKPTGRQRAGSAVIYEARCPAHHDKDPSFEVGLKDNGEVWVYCYAGCTKEAIYKALGLNGQLGAISNKQEQGFDSLDDLIAKAYGSLVKSFGNPRQFHYHSRKGDVVGCTLRWDTNDGKQIRPAWRRNGKWSPSLSSDEKFPLYQLPEICQSKGYVLVVEGEKCVEALRGLGFVATTSIGGANSPHRTDWSPLRGREVVILPDHDGSGRKYAQKVMPLCQQAEARKARILDLAKECPSLPEGGDIADIIARPELIGKQNAQEVADWLRKLVEETLALKYEVRAERAGKDRFRVRLVDDQGETVYSDVFDPSNAGKRKKFLTEAKEYATDLTDQQLLELDKQLMTIPDQRMENETVLSAGQSDESDAADRLYDEARQFIRELFTADDGTRMATVETSEGFVEHYNCNSAAFKEWLTTLYCELFGTTQHTETIRRVADRFSSDAKKSGKKYRTSIRVARTKDAIYLDLARPEQEPEQQIVRVTSDGWDIIRERDLPDEVKFIRPPEMLQLPIPDPNGGVEDLNKFRSLFELNDDDWAMVVGWWINALWGPRVDSGARRRNVYPILLITGPHGSGKTTLATAIAHIIHLNLDDADDFPEQWEDLIVIAQNSWVLAFDNVGWVANKIANTLCILSTGGRMRKRRRYTDKEISSIRLTRPIIITSINRPTNQPDLLDRVFSVELPDRGDADPLDEDEIAEQVEQMHPRILGALLHALAEALRNYKNTKQKLKARKRLRMFGPIIRVEAAAAKLGLREGQFLEIYSKLREGVSYDLVEQSKEARLVLDYINDRGYFCGTVEQLLDELKKWLSDLRAGVGLLSTGTRRSAEDYELPKDTPRLGKLLNKLTPEFARLGIEMKREKRTALQKKITINKKSSDNSPEPPFQYGSPQVG